MRFVWMLFAILVLCGCRSQELLTNLDQQQANEVLAALQRHNIYAEKKNEGKSGFSVSVDKKDFAAAVDWLRIYHLPARSNIEISQMFPADSLVSSPRAEKARLYSAIEQRLEQSVRTMDGVMSARVHVSYDIEAGESGRASAPVHLSVLAIYDRDINPEQLVNDIKRFMVNSFSGVQYENISVVLSRRSEVQQQAPTSTIQVNSWGGERSIAIIVIVSLVIGIFLTIFWVKREHLRSLRKKKTVAPDES